MKRLSLCLAIVAAFAFVAPTVPAGAGCMPEGVPNTPCSYLAIPQTLCRTAENTLTSNPNLPADAKTLVRNAAVCAKVPNGYNSTGQDANVFYLGQSMVVPNDAVKVGIGRYIYIQNLDGDGHTFTDPGCLDTNSTTPCRFNIGAQYGQFGIFAQKLLLSSAKFEAGKIYRFVCALSGHTEEGTFEVTD